ncbi:MAG: GNAT family protein [bacterium]|nr:GNAT family protein [bacterium]
MEVNIASADVSSVKDKIFNFLRSEPWMFYSTPLLSEEYLNELMQKGYFEGDNTRSFFIETMNDEIAGMMRLFDLQDIGRGSPMFDIRISSPYRGKGIGSKAMKWITDYVFNTWQIQNRFEGTTRFDNLVMRKLFIKSGFVLEGYYRQAWHGHDGIIHDSLQYSILRSDWISGTPTAINWDEVK